MSLRTRARWNRVAGALLAVAVLVPALHDATSHQVLVAGDVTIVADAAGDTGALAPELCPICLAGHSAAAVVAAPDTTSAPLLAVLARLPAAPPLPARAVIGAAGPRAPPSA